MSDEMSFDERFPSFYNEVDGLIIDEGVEGFDRETIKKYCLDKQLVKEAIDYALEHLPQGKRILLKELGLE